MTDTEKVTMNMSVVDLGRIDLMVSEGFYSSRTDFIRTAVRNLLDTHTENVQQTVTRKSMVIGALSYDRQSLEEKWRKGIKLEIKVVGLLHIAQDVPAELVGEVVQSAQVYGVIRASQEVKNILQEKAK